ncbi:MAG: DUF5801 domain-containing protein [Cyanobium sp. LacPavin_0818_WC50_MAG_67_9]|nr:DUF5801 domain-containing protein [Cyanobium sp. LacPavin_0818_WC50_MAG_67_9]
MAKHLITMLIDRPQAGEDQSRLAGNMQDAVVVDTAGSTDNPGGITPTGGASDNTITEQAPESQPPAVNVTQDIPEPETAVGGGHGGLAGATTTSPTKNSDQPRVAQTGVAQDDPALSPFTPQAAGEDDDDPPAEPDGDDNVTSEPVLIVDETGLGTDATENFSDNFSSAFGSDAAGSVTYALTTTGGASGLVDTATGQAVNLSLSGGVVEGRTATSNDLVFTVSVNSTTGLVTLDQIRAVVHPTSDPNEPMSLSADHLVRLTATITDRDGDTQSATLDIGSNLLFLDDGPSISTTATLEPVLTVDETVLGTNATVNFSGNFSSAFGSDGAGSVTYALTTAGGASGLVDTATGQVVNLYLIGGQIVGSTSTTEGGVNAGTTNFTVTVDGLGNVTLDQSQAVTHPNPANPDDSVSLVDGLIGLKATITDRDGDTANVTLNIGGNLVFKDDGPTITASSTVLPVLTVDESDFATNPTQSFAANFTTAFGADGFLDADNNNVEAERHGDQ